MTTITITFGALPEKATPASPSAHSARHEAIAAALQERPGEWAHVDTKPSRDSAQQTAHRVKRGFTAAYRPAGAYEASARHVDGEFRVYARYVGTAAN